MSHSVPIPLEDELAFGMLERFAQLNGISSEKQAIQLLKISNTNNGDRPLLWSLADACGIEQNDFMLRHSMLPAMYPISSYAGSPREHEQRRTMAYRGLATSLETLRWCAECSKSDIKLRGLSHWRRLHQIAGIDWCTVHRVPLSLSRKRATISASGTKFEQPGLIDVSVEELNNSALLRLQDILQDWLNRGSPILLKAWTKVIGERCQLLGLRAGEIGKRKVASDRIKEQFPSSWLNKHFPEIANKSAHVFIRKVDGACSDKHVAYPALACAAILAALFDSAQEAIDALDDANDQFTEGISTDLTHIAVVAFLKGAPLRQACNKAGAKMTDVEAYLRKTLQRLGAGSGEHV